eukprot:TRINITY_DN12088_c0_g1_i2.p1 TRINITY_DN12088_c0_g1~~TRINITY_DN12088_c0_g1_i2.p1  ORF type:complete len:352 (+),score=137.95 TRINITY_DN12088_c0_g1_i2:450-1505(+)
MPPSTQVVVVDVYLPLKVAFVSAVENRVPFATLWDSQAERIVGMMTVTDYIKVLLHRRRSGDMEMRLEETPIYQWRQLEWMRREGAQDRQVITAAVSCTAEAALRTLHRHSIKRQLEWMRREGAQDRQVITAAVSCTAEAALRTLHRHSIKRLPLLSDDGAVLHVLNHSALLQLLVDGHLREVLPQPGDQPVGDETMAGTDTAATAGSLPLTRLYGYAAKDLGVGVYGGAELPALTLDMPVYAVLESLLEHRRHSLPIVDERRRLMDTFNRNDVIKLEQRGHYNVDKSLGEALTGRDRPIAVYGPDDSLGSVIELLHGAGEQTVYCVDEDRVLCGHLGVQHLFGWIMQHGG